MPRVTLSKGHPKRTLQIGNRFTPLMPAPVPQEVQGNGCVGRQQLFAQRLGSVSHDLPQRVRQLGVDVCFRALRPALDAETNSNTCETPGNPARVASLDFRGQRMIKHLCPLVMNLRTLVS